MRRYITTEAKRKKLDALWRKYERIVRRWIAAKGIEDNKEVMAEAHAMRATIEDFVYDNGGTLE